MYAKPAHSIVADLLSDLTEGGALEEELDYLDAEDEQQEIPSRLLRSLVEHNLALALSASMERFLKAESEAMSKREETSGEEEEAVESQAVYNTFSVVENMIEVKKSLFIYNT